MFQLRIGAEVVGRVTNVLNRGIDGRSGNVRRVGTSGNIFDRHDDRAGPDRVRGRCHWEEVGK